MQYKKTVMGKELSFIKNGKTIIMYANLVILATAVTYYQLSGGESGTLRWLCSLLDKLDITTQDFSWLVPFI